MLPDVSVNGVSVTLRLARARSLDQSGGKVGSTG
ncbi:MAG: hypothetical protein DMF64_01035 [Acidobacteria bacterium]|nr:MAG: hypothetical protein DMF64_01035 [Acidobacteriota bacterium]